MAKYLYLEDGKPYHTSAVYASALHSMSLPFRMEPYGPSAQVSCTSGAVTINDLVLILAGQGRQNMVPVLDVSMPAPALTGIIFWVLPYPYLGIDSLLYMKYQVMLTRCRVPAISVGDIAAAYPRNS